MDEREKNEQPQVEDLEMQEKEAEDVKGGAWYAKFDGVDGSFQAADGSVRPTGLGGGPHVKPGGTKGIDGGMVQHNETLLTV